jgi:type II secretory pathway pseudopilin PulG
MFRRYRSSRAMTLIELILVMFLLATIMAFSAPALSRFVSGRSLNEDARRLLSMTKYARSQAISRGTTMRLWIDSEAGRCGVKVDDPYDNEGFRPVEYGLDERAQFVIDEKKKNDEGLALIRYASDGNLAEDSVRSVAIVGKKRDALALLWDESDGGHYVIRDYEAEE